MRNAVGHAHRRPLPLAIGVGGHGGIQGGHRRVGIQQRRAAEDHLPLAIGFAQVHRAAYRRQRAAPLAQLTADQVVALLDRCIRAPLLRDVVEAWEQRFEVQCHGGSLCNGPAWWADPVWLF
ncbi:MAG: hypothetical protein GAK45_02363 [Pseudomonas citronellolis]|nr:MAG: hypothetical protein GAK45_02363 [Pseudomonas citronellolis]